jgi:anaerobic magnesium-protoporphyrin IX monomethyl ester cyclase
MARVLLISVNDVNAEGLRMLSAILRQRGHQPYIVFLQRNGFPYSDTRQYLEASREVEEYDWTGIDAEGRLFRYCRGPDLTAEELRLLLSLIDEIKPDVIGFTVTQPFVKSIARLSGLIRERFTIPIIWGGPAPTSAPRSCSQWCDFVCVGEGDRTIVDIAARIDNGEGLREVNNIAYRHGGEFVQNPLHPLVDNLDELPFKDILPENKFLIEDDRLISNFGAVSYSGRYHVATARGCPFSCSYCSENYIKGLYPRQKYLRRRTPSNVIEELVEVQKTAHYGIVQFEDEVFALNAEWLEAFVVLYKERIGVPFECYIYPSNRIEKQLKVLKEAGLLWTCLSLQSGSDRINREVFKRHFDKKLYLETAHILRGLGISFYVDVITFNPFETREDLQATLAVLLRLPGQFPVFVNKLYLIEGTAIHASALELKDAKDVTRVNDRTFRHYSRLFHATGRYPKYAVRLADQAKIFEYSPFLLNMYFGLVRLAMKVKDLPKAVAGYIALQRQLTDRLSQVGAQQVNPQTLVPVGEETLFSVDLIDNLQPVQHDFTLVIDTRKFKVIPMRRIVTLIGWAIDQKAGTAAGGVFISINGERDIMAFYGLDRPDVATHFKNSRYRFSGFSASFRTSLLDKGKNILSVKVITADRNGYYAPQLKIILDVR